jgi:EpsI family protein
MNNFRFILTVSILLAAAAGNYFFSKPDISLPRRTLAEFPRKIGEWTVVSEHQIDDQSMKILQVDDYIMRSYCNSKGEIMGLYIGYFKSQREGKGIHSPRQCLPGAGWAPINNAVYQIPVGNHNRETVSVNKFVMEKGLERQLYLFWYQGRGRIYASEYWNKIYLIWDSLTRKRTDGALIRIQNSANRNMDEALKTQIEFINLFLPFVKEYIPH